MTNYQNDRNYDVIMSSGLSGSTLATLAFSTPWSAQAGTSETLNSVTMNQTFIVKRFKMLVRSNAKTAAFTGFVRVAGVDTALSLLIGAGVTGEFDTGLVNLVINPGQKLTFKVDLTGTGAGAVAIVFWIEGFWKTN